MRRRGVATAGLVGAVAAAVSAVTAAGPGAGAPLPDVAAQLRAELDYVTRASWSDLNPNSAGWSWFDPGDDIHGAINDVRIPTSAPPNREGWVEPAIGATAAIGVMQGLRHLHAGGLPLAPYDAVLERFFRVWELDHVQGRNLDAQSPDLGAFMNRVDYDSRGAEATGSPVWKTDVTALMLTANWKYFEFLVATGQAAAAADWLARAWPVERAGSDYLVRMHDTTPAGAIHLLPGNSSEPHYDAWIHFAGYAVPALRAASVWARNVGAPHASYDRVAADLVVGLQAMKDPGSRSLYRRFVPWQGSRYGAPTYGESIDQLTFVPVETGAVASDAFAGRISDWFTDGEPGLRMTWPTPDPSDWRYFGTHWNWYFAGAPENDRLYPGPGFQLAKVEWKFGVAVGAPEYVARSRRRLDWGRRLGYSALWWYLTGEEEASTPNGFVDWRDATDSARRGERWARFVDTSAYFIEVLLMHEAGTDTDHNPRLPACAGGAGGDATCDADGDGILGASDDCRLAPNPEQLDSDRDGYGNACDADYDGDGRVGLRDFLTLGRAWGATTGSPAYVAAHDADGDGPIGLPELLLLGRAFGGPPGPSGLACAGSAPCP